MQSTYGRGMAIIIGIQSMGIVEFILDIENLWALMSTMVPCVKLLTHSIYVCICSCQSLKNC